MSLGTQSKLFFIAAAMFFIAAAIGLVSRGFDFKALGGLTMAGVMLTLGVKARKGAAEGQAS